MGNFSSKPSSHPIIGHQVLTPSMADTPIPRNHKVSSAIHVHTATGAEDSLPAGTVTLRPSKLDSYLINLSYLNLGSLTDVLFLAAQNLRGLHLSHNQLTSLPESLGQLQNLCFLDVSFNRLTSLPASLASLTQMLEIKASRNLLTEIPAGLTSLVHLEAINLAHNQIKEVPQEMGKLTALITLNLEGNPLQFLPAEIAQLKFLRYINVDACPLYVEAPAPVCDAPRIPTLKELSARVLARHSIPLPEEALPAELVEYVGSARKCTFCQGPHYEFSVERYQFVTRDSMPIPLQFRLCSAHWNKDRDRILKVFMPTPLTAPSKLEPARLQAIVNGYTRALEPETSSSRKSKGSQIPNGRKPSFSAPGTATAAAGLSSSPSAQSFTTRNRRKASFATTDEISSSSLSLYPLKFPDQIHSLKNSNSSLLHRD